MILRILRARASRADLAGRVWESAFALDAATTAGGFVGGQDMRVYYATEPAIEHFTALDLEAAWLEAAAPS